MREVAQDDQLFSFIKDMCRMLKNDPDNEEALQRNLQGILWMKEKLDAKNNAGALFEQNTREFKRLTASKNDKHVMISYNSESRELCLEIKRELERLGHAVWIDVEAISGSSLESMAKAVENAKCVLICWSKLNI
jgi:hypothetical protein